MEQKIIDHNNIAYMAKRDGINQNRFNGAFYYSKEITENIIPRVKTDRSWITINAQGVGTSHAIVFVHNNEHPENYDWLSAYSDLILVCGVPETCEKVSRLGKAVYLPLSVDVQEVKKYRQEKTRDICFAGRAVKRDGIRLPSGIDYVENCERKKFLTRLGKYRQAYAVGRAAIEARVLGCKILPYDPRFPDPGFWKVVDNREAAEMLQKIIDEIDGDRNEF